MDFFKSFFSKDSQPSSESSESDNPSPKPNTMWSSVIGAYRKDFEEFRSGLKKETAVIQEAASRAVKELPASFEIGASVAQESLESVGQAIDDIGSTVWKSTAEIISHGRRNIISQQSDQFNPNSHSNSNNDSRRFIDVKGYSRFEKQLHSVQSDYDTYCKDPEDLQEYGDWKQGFKLDDEKYSEIESLIKENELIGETFREFVSTNAVVDEETFWSRYFYRVHKLKQAEEARATLVKRAISMEEDEDFSWDIDEDEDEDSGSLVKVEVESSGDLEGKERDSNEEFVNNSDVENLKNENSGVGENDDEKFVHVEEKTENSDSCKDSDLSVVSSQPSIPEEEDLGWDAIEDSGSNDESKGDAVGSMSRADLRNRLSAAREDEDLSWDIEDDDELVKS